MKGITIITLLFVLFLGVVYGAFSATGNNYSVDMDGKIIRICQNDNSTPDSVLVDGVPSGKT